MGNFGFFFGRASLRGMSAMQLKHRCKAYNALSDYLMDHIVACPFKKQKTSVLHLVEHERNVDPWSINEDVSKAPSFSGIANLNVETNKK